MKTLNGFVHGGSAIRYQASSLSNSNVQKLGQDKKLAESNQLPIEKAGWSSRLTNG